MATSVVSLFAFAVLGVVLGLVLVALGTLGYVVAAALLLVALIRRRLDLSLVVAGAGASSFFVLLSALVTCSPTAGRPCQLDSGLAGLLAVSAVLVLLGLVGVRLSRPG